MIGVNNMNKRFAKRKARRNAIKAIIPILETILQLEMQYYESIPPTQTNEDRYLESELFVGCLDCAVDDLRLIKKSINL
jgi:regulator of sigma D